MDWIFAQSVAFFSMFYLMSLVMTVGCNDWFLIWVGLEINMMSFIALVYDRTSMGVELCLKYFFIQSIGSGILIMMFYCEFFWFEYVCLSVLSYKVGGGPFFFWFPSMCDMLSWGSCLLLMTVQKVLPLLIMSFLMSLFFWFIVIVSILVGALGAFNQKRVKRLMAYSSIHHIGWILTAQMVGSNWWLVYLVMYGVLIFGVILSLMKDKVLEVGKLGNLSSKWSFLFSMLSMGGMPPMLGFYLKWWLFYNLLLIDYSILFFMLVTSLFMFYVYLRIVYFVLMESVVSESWSFLKSGMMNISGEFFIILGLNMGLIVWMVF